MDGWADGLTNVVVSLSCLQGCVFLSLSLVTDMSQMHKWISVSSPMCLVSRPAVHAGFSAGRTGQKRGENRGKRRTKKAAKVKV